MKATFKDYFVSLWRAVAFGVMLFAPHWWEKSLAVGAILAVWNEGRDGGQAQGQSKTQGIGLQNSNTPYYGQTQQRGFGVNPDIGTPEKSSQGNEDHEKTSG